MGNIQCHFGRFSRPDQVRLSNKAASSIDLNSFEIFVGSFANGQLNSSPASFRYMVEQGVVKPLCDLLVCPDPRIITVCLEGLENILKVGEAEKVTGNTGDVNFYAQLIDDAEGLEKIENLQSHDNSEIYEKAVKILETYWLEEEDETLPPGDPSAQGFQFGGGNDAAVPPGGFNFK